jgi:hypothetical protein
MAKLALVVCPISVIERFSIMPSWKDYEQAGSYRFVHRISARKALEGYLEPSWAGPPTAKSKGQRPRYPAISNTNKSRGE